MPEGRQSIIQARQSTIQGRQSTIPGRQSTQNVGGGWESASLLFFFSRRFHGKDIPSWWTPRPTRVRAWSLRGLDVQPIPNPGCERSQHTRGAPGRRHRSCN